MTARHPHRRGVTPMQMAGPVPCPECDDGKKPSGKLCAVCCGSGRVYLVPAERYRDPKETAKFWEQMQQAQKGIYE